MDTDNRTVIPSPEPCAVEYVLEQMGAPRLDLLSPIENISVEENERAVNSILQHALTSPQPPDTVDESSMIPVHFLDPSQICETVVKPTGKTDKISRGPKLICRYVFPNKSADQPLTCGNGCYIKPFCSKHRKTVQYLEYLKLVGGLSSVEEETLPRSSSRRQMAPLFAKAYSQALVKKQQQTSADDIMKKHSASTIMSQASGSSLQPMSVTCEESIPSKSFAIMSQASGPSVQPVSVTCEKTIPSKPVACRRRSMKRPLTSLVEKDKGILQTVLNTQGIPTKSFRALYEGCRYIVVIEHLKPHAVTVLREGSSDVLKILLPKSFEMVADIPGKRKYLRKYTHLYKNGRQCKRLRWLFRDRV